MQSELNLNYKKYFRLTRQQLKVFHNETSLKVDKEKNKSGEIQKSIKTCCNNYVQKSYKSLAYNKNILDNCTKKSEWN